MAERSYYCYYGTYGNLKWAMDLCQKNIDYNSGWKLLTDRRYAERLAEHEAEMRELKREEGLLLSPIPYGERSKGLFRGVEHLHLHAFYFYEEGGIFYEFFTGQEYGKLAMNEWRRAYVESPYKNIPLEGAWYSDTNYAYRLSESDFAKHVKPYVEHMELVGKAVSKRLKHIKDTRDEEKKLKEAAEKKQENEDRENETWLNAFFDRLRNS